MEERVVIGPWERRRGFETAATQRGFHGSDRREAEAEQATERGVGLDMAMKLPSKEI